MPTPCESWPRRFASTRLSATCFASPGDEPAAEAADKARAAGDAGPLAGIPLGIKDLFATKGVHTQAASHILDGFKPEYESTVTSQLATLPLFHVPLAAASIARTSASVDRKDATRS